jgi:hypothetical protein
VVRVEVWPTSRVRSAEAEHALKVGTVEYERATGLEVTGAKHFASDDGMLSAQGDPAFAVQISAGELPRSQLLNAIVRGRRSQLTSPPRGRSPTR